MTGLDDSWQAALAGEHQAVFGYALLGPRLTGDERQLALTCSAEHQATLDATASAIAAAGLTPVGAMADYPRLYPVADAAAARRTAVTVEDAAATAWRLLYLSATASRNGRGIALRTSAQGGLTACAVRSARWRLLGNPANVSSPFPGIS